MRSTTQLTVQSLIEGGNDWLSVRNSKRRFFAITLSSTGVRIPLPPSSAFITQRSIVYCLRQVCPRPNAHREHRSLIPTSPSSSRHWHNTPGSRLRGCMPWHSNAVTWGDPAISARISHNCARANRAKPIFDSEPCRANSHKLTGVILVTFRSVVQSGR